LIGLTAGSPGAWGEAQADTVTVTGVVTDARGKPLPALQVVLTASKKFFSFRRFRVREVDAKRVYGTTGEDGSFSLSWPPDESYNSFRLAVALPSSGEGSEARVLKEVDVTRRMDDGPTVSASLVVDELVPTARGVPPPPPPRPASRGTQEGRSADQQRVFLEQGEPDRIRSTPYQGGTEVTWWYFERGKVYRFENGQLRDVVQFSPVLEF
jgi:hypothetical protein